MSQNSTTSYRSRRFLLPLAIVLLVAGRADAQQFVDQVPGIKADCLAVFGYYFTWPESASEEKEFVIGLLGKAPFSAQRVTAKVKSITGKRIVVRQFDSAEDYRPCHILFVADDADDDSAERTAKERLAAALDAVGESPVLVVAETDGFATQGAIVNFYVDTAANKVRMQINREAAGKAKLGLARGLFQLQRTGKVVFVKDE